jgi:hypothetical protein
MMMRELSQFKADAARKSHVREKNKTKKNKNK